jgi:hypothetical protein
MKGGNMHTCRLIWWLLIPALLLLLPGEVVADELKEGTWTGAVLPARGDRYRVKYDVSYENISDQKKLHIKMIYLDLEPAPEYTYDLTDIKLTNGQLSFKIPEKFEIMQCTLDKQNDNSFSGKCQSDTAEDGQTSQIAMVPPPDDPQEPGP